MDQKALKKAQLRLSVARKAAEALYASEDFGAFSEQWYIFLHASKGIYTTLEQGTKITAQSRQWFGAKNQERKDDPLLRYISEARNDDEHGIEETIQHSPSEIGVGVSPPGASRYMTDQFGNIYMNRGRGDVGFLRLKGFPLDHPAVPRLQPLDGKPAMVAYKPESIALKPVRDRSNRVYDPPAEHLGKPLKSADPEDVAKLTIEYLTQLVAEAEGLRTS